jgi:hypothetical protein
VTLSTKDSVDGIAKNAADNIRLTFKREKHLIHCVAVIGSNAPQKLCIPCTTSPAVGLGWGVEAVQLCV